MENASKALIMAGSVLIALMIIGALLLMFNSLSSYQEVGTQNTREAQVIEFNNQYETYNRNNVRGSDLYSLLNRVVDYNRRKSTEGTGKDEGQYLAYEPMKITFDLDGKIDQFYAPTASSKDTYTHLIKKGGYEQSSTVNEFENDIGSTIGNLESKYGANSLTNLTTGLTKIFIAYSSTDVEKDVAIENFKNAYKKNQIDNINIENITWENIKEGSTIRKDVYQYYEYVQFKRAKFNCQKNSYSDTNIKYNEKTGRIIEMNFKFTGKFE